MNAQGKRNPCSKVKPLPEKLPVLKIYEPPVEALEKGRPRTRYRTASGHVCELIWANGSAQAFIRKP